MGCLRFMVNAGHIIRDRVNIRENIVNPEVSRIIRRFLRPAFGDITFGSFDGAGLSIGVVVFTEIAEWITLVRFEFYAVSFHEIFLCGMRTVHCIQNL